MKYETSDQIIRVRVDELKAAPINKQVHADFDPHGRDAWLVDDIKRNGVLVPLIIRPYKEIKEGHRRWLSAKLSGQRDVPCVVLTDGDDSQAFASAQLARNLSTFAKCLLYRKFIVALIERGASSRNAALKKQPVNVEQESELRSVDQDWSQVEEVLGVGRRTLVEGVRLLAEIETIRDSGRPEAQDWADKIESLFRNRGLNPALRMLGDTPQAADDAEPDCATWDTGAPQEKTIRKGGAKAALTVKAAKKSAVAGAIAPSAAGWQQEAFKHLAAVEKLLRANKHYPVFVAEALDMVEHHINEFAQRKAS
jgi:ParB-like chromosome segregation protein Spo0J